MEWFLYTAGVVLLLIGLYLMRLATIKMGKAMASAAVLDGKIAEGFYPKSDIDKAINEYIEEFREENIDAIMLIQMSEGIKNGALDMVGVDGIVLMSEAEYERLERSDHLVSEMNKVSKGQGKVVN